MEPVTSRWRLFYLLHFSKPSTDRALYQAIHQRKLRSILEFGVGKARRALRMIQVAQRHFPGREASYVGVDPFEDRRPDDGPGVPLKTAYQVLRGTGAQVRLLPGDPWSAMSRAANSMSGVDLLVVSAGWGRASLARAWLYVPRVLRAQSLVVHQQSDATGQPAGFRVLLPRHVEELAQRALRRAA